jgi:Glutamate-cysteine ligase family 2(GCS2)
MAYQQRQTFLRLLDTVRCSRCCHAAAGSSLGRGQGEETKDARCVWQVNLDFVDEADMVQMARLGIALQPIATALFANSPFRDGKPTGYLSWRSHVWTDTASSPTGVTNSVPGLLNAFSALSAAARACRAADADS